MKSEDKINIALLIGYAKLYTKYIPMHMEYHRKEVFEVIKRVEKILKNEKDT